MNIVPVDSRNELVLRLLEDCKLPVADISASRSVQLFGAYAGSELLGVVGLEAYAPVALLRSLAVSPAARNTGTGRALVAFVEAEAASRNVASLFLLTMTAASFFEALGYAPLPREEAPDAIKATAQFSGLCPASSSFMVKRLSW